MTGDVSGAADQGNFNPIFTPPTGTSTQAQEAGETSEAFLTHWMSSLESVQLKTGGGALARIVGDPSSPSLIEPGPQADPNAMSWFSSHMNAFYEALILDLGSALMEMEESMAELQIGMMEAERSTADTIKDLGVKAAELEKKMAMYQAVGHMISAVGNFVQAGGAAAGLAVMKGWTPGKLFGKLKNKAAEQKAGDTPDAQTSANETLTKAGAPPQNTGGPQKQQSNVQNQPADVDEGVVMGQKPTNDQAQNVAQNKKVNEDAEADTISKDQQTADDKKEKNLKTEQKLAQIHVGQTVSSMIGGIGGSMQSIGQAVGQFGTILHAVEKAEIEGDKQKMQTLMEMLRNTVSALQQDRQDMQKMQSDLNDKLTQIAGQTTNNQRISASGA